MTVKKHKVYKVEDKEGEVHVKTTGCEFDPFETFCGELENHDNKLERTKKPLTCSACKSTFEVLKNGITLTA